MSLDKMRAIVVQARGATNVNAVAQEATFTMETNMTYTFMSDEGDVSVINPTLEDIEATVAGRSLERFFPALAALPPCVTGPDEPARTCSVG